MDAYDAVDLSRSALWIGALISAPLLLVGLVVAVLVGLLQAMTQVQEQTVAFVPKLLAMAVALALALPWMLGVLVDYVRELFDQMPGSLG